MFKQLDEVLQKVATKVVEEVREARTIGLGSGAAVSAFVRALGRDRNGGKIATHVIPSSTQIQIESERVGLKVTSPNLLDSIDFTVDGADQIDSNLNMIKGGGGALFREKILLRAAKCRIIIADESKFKKSLVRTVPVEVHPFARIHVQSELEKMGGKPSLRLLEKGYPYVTENGNFIFETDFGVIRKPRELERAVKIMPGVIEVGIFVFDDVKFYKFGANGKINLIQ